MIPKKTYTINDIIEITGINSEEFYSIFYRYNFFRIYPDEVNDCLQWAEVDLNLFKAGFFRFQGELVEISTDKVKGVGDLYFTEKGVNWVHMMLTWLSDYLLPINLFQEE